MVLNMAHPIRFYSLETDISYKRKANINYQTTEEAHNHLRRRLILFHSA